MKKPVEMGELLAEMERIGAVVRNSHLVYTSGKHGSEYVNKDAIYPYTQLISFACESIAEKFRGEEIEAVLAPALGGIVLTQWVSHHLQKLTGRTVLALYAEKHEDGFILKRGYDKLIAGKKTLILEDILTTGGSVKKIVNLARELGAQVMGVAALCNRGGLTAKELSNAPVLHSMISLKLDSWDAKDCPLCAKNVPINTNVGKGLEFVKAQGKSLNN